MVDDKWVLAFPNDICVKVKVRDLTRIWTWCANSTSDICYNTQTFHYKYECKNPYDIEEETERDSEKSKVWV